LTTDDDGATRAGAIRGRARELLGRDSESLNERMFVRILKDAHDAGVIDLRRRGDDFEVARATEAAPVAEQVARADAAAAQSRPSLGGGAPTVPRIGMGPRGAGGRVRARLEGLPPELLAVGVVDEPVAPAPAAAVAPLPLDVEAAPAPAPSAEEEPRPRRSGRKRARSTPVEAAAVVPTAPQPSASTTPASAAPSVGSAPAVKRSRAKASAKTAHRRARAKKTATKSPEE